METFGVTQTTSQNGYTKKPSLKSGFEEFFAVPSLLADPHARPDTTSEWSPQSLSVHLDNLNLNPVSERDGEQKNFDTLWYDARGFGKQTRFGSSLKHNVKSSESTGSHGTSVSGFSSVALQQLNEDIYGITTPTTNSTFASNKSIWAAPQVYSFENRSIQKTWSDDRIGRENIALYGNVGSFGAERALQKRTSSESNIGSSLYGIGGSFTLNTLDQSDMRRDRSVTHSSIGSNTGARPFYSSKTAGLLQSKLGTELEMSSVYREKLVNLVNYYKKHFNNGYGLIPIINSFTARHKFENNHEVDAGYLFRDCQSQEQLLQLLGSYNFQTEQDLMAVGEQLSLSLRNQKKKDFCSKVQVRDGMKTVLYEVEFVKKGRWALFQGVDFLVETGEKLVNLIDQEVVIEMDGGIDLAVLRTIEYMPLIPGIQEVPFMPAMRRPTHFDRMKYESKDSDELIVLRFCRELLKYPEFMHYNMTVTDVEFQIDRKKLIIFAEFVTKVKFNKYVKQIFEHCKHVFKKKNIKPRIFIQNKFVGQN